MLLGAAYATAQEVGGNVYVLAPPPPQKMARKFGLPSLPLQLPSPPPLLCLCDGRRRTHLQWGAIHLFRPAVANSNPRLLPVPVARLRLQLQLVMGIVRGGTRRVSARAAHLSVHLSALCRQVSMRIRLAVQFCPILARHRSEVRHSCAPAS